MGSVHSVFRHMWLESTSRLLAATRGQCSLASLSDTAAGVGVDYSFSSFLEVNMSQSLVDSKAKEVRCNGIIYHPGTSKSFIGTSGRVLDGLIIQKK